MKKNSMGFTDFRLRGNLSGSDYRPTSTAMAQAYTHYRTERNALNERTPVAGRDNAKQEIEQRKSGCRSGRNPALKKTINDSTDAAPASEFGGGILGTGISLLEALFSLGLASIQPFHDSNKNRRSCISPALRSPPWAGPRARPGPTRNRDVHLPEQDLSLIRNLSATQRVSRSIAGQGIHDHNHLG